MVRRNRTAFRHALVAGRADHGCQAARAEGPRTDADPEQYRQMGLAYTIPALLVAPIVLLTLLGAWVDHRMHGSSVCTLLGAVLGSVVGLMNMIRAAQKLKQVSAARRVGRLPDA